MRKMNKKALMKQYQSFVFFIGWVLSPLTTWNDAFINIPLSYLIANFIYMYMPIRRHFSWLFIGSYILTNILGLALMYFSGKEYVLSAKSKMKAVVSLIVNTAIFSAVIYLLDQSGILAPLSVYISKIYYH